MPCNGENNFRIHVAVCPHIAEGSPEAEGFEKMVALKLNSIPEFAVMQKSAVTKYLTALKKVICTAKV